MRWIHGEGHGHAAETEVYGLSFQASRSSLKHPSTWTWTWTWTFDPDTSELSVKQTDQWNHHRLNEALQLRLQTCRITTYKVKMFLMEVLLDLHLESLNRHTNLIRLGLMFLRSRITLRSGSGRTIWSGLFLIRIASNLRINLHLYCTWIKPRMAPGSNPGMHPGLNPHKRPNHHNRLNQDNGLKCHNRLNRHNRLNQDNVLNQG